MDNPVREPRPAPIIRPIAIVTGAAGGMGRACARRLANTHRLVLTDINADRLSDLAESLREDDNAEIVAMPCGDIGDDDVLSRVAEAAGQGPCKVLVHTAGLSPALAGWKAIITANLVGTARLLDAVEPLLSPGFVGVLLSSTARLFAAPAGADLAAALADPLQADLMARLEPILGENDAARTEAAYAYSKMWVHDTVRRRAARWSGHGARIVSLSPGFVRTGMTKVEVNERPEIRALFEATPVGRWGTVSDIANAVEFLLSDKASFITGSDIIIDGGLSARLLGGG